MNTPSRILIIKLSAMGDIVHAMPTAVALKNSFPECRIEWVVQSGFADLLQAHAAVDELVKISRRPTIGELLRLRSRLRENRYDYAIDLQGLCKSARIIAVSRASHKIGFQGQRECSWLFSQPIRSSAPHVVDQYLAVAEHIGARIHSPSFDLKPNAEAQGRVRELFDSLELSGRIVTINLGSGGREKRWPVSRYGELIHLLESERLSPLIIGGPGDAPSYEELCAQMKKRVPSLVGRTSIAELIAVIASSDAHIAGDTGSIHIAAALAKPLVCLMGPTDPDRSGPYRRRENVLYKGPDGLSSITPEEVCDALLGAL